ncbi:MAG: TOBE domain-containing protein, partial [Bacillota bacterium]
ARALAGEPEILFLDEPMANLDNPTRVAFRRDLTRVLAHLRATAVYVTHEVSEALYLGNRIAVMSRGRLVQDAAPAEVWNHPASPEVASLVGVDDLLRGVVQGSAGGFTRVRCGDTDILSTSRAPAGAEVMVCVRPEHVLVGDSFRGERTPEQGDRDSNQDNRLAGVVVSVEPLGTITAITLNCGFAITAHVIGQPGQDLNLSPGARVCVRISPGHVHLIEVGKDNRPA